MNSANWHDFQSATHLILVVTRNGHVSENVKKYAIEVAERTEHDLLFAYVNTLPQLFTRSAREEQMMQIARKDFDDISETAADSNIKTAFVFESGRIGKAVARLCHLRKKINFVVIDENIRMIDVVNHSPVPVFRGTGRGPESSRPLRQKIKGTQPRRHHDMTFFLASQQLIRFSSATALTLVIYYFLFEQSEQLDLMMSTGLPAGLLAPTLVAGLFFSQSFMMASFVNLLSIVFKTGNHMKHVVITPRPDKQSKLKSGRQLSQHQFRR